MSLLKTTRKTRACSTFKKLQFHQLNVLPIACISMPQFENPSFSFLQFIHSFCYISYKFPRKETIHMMYGLACFYLHKNYYPPPPKTHFSNWNWKITIQPPIAIGADYLKPKVELETPSSNKLIAFQKRPSSELARLYACLPQISSSTNYKNDNEFFFF